MTNTQIIDSLVSGIVAEIKDFMGDTYNATHGDEGLQVFLDEDLYMVVEDGLKDFEPEENSEIGDREVRLEDLDFECYLGDRDIVLYDRETSEGVVFLILEDVEGGYKIRGPRTR